MKRITYKDENNLLKIMEENKDGENINSSTIHNQEKPNSSFNNSTIMDINNKLKDKIPEIRIKNENELIIEEIVNNQSLLEYKIKSNETKIRVFGKNFVKII